MKLESERRENKNKNKNKNKKTLEQQHNSTLKMSETELKQQDNLSAPFEKGIKTLKREGVGTSNFTTTTGHFFHYIKNVFLVHHYYEITTSKMSF